MATKKKKVHKATTNAHPDSYPLCGRGIGPLTKDARRSPGGRCQMIMNFAAKRVGSEAEEGEEVAMAGIGRRKKPNLMAKPKSQLELATDEVKEKLEEMCSVKCPVEDYIAALEDISALLEASIDAAKDDIRRKNEEG